jgi:CRP-like cAMP-binding protein
MDSVLREHLQHSKLFAKVGLESVEHLFEGCERRKLERGDHLLEADAANGHLYLILGGEFRVYLQGRDMPAQAVLVGGDCVGEMSLLDGQPASALVLAAQDSEVLAIPHEVVWSLVDCSHGVARNLLAIISGRVRQGNQALVAMQERSLEFEEEGSVDALTGIHNRRWLLEAFPRAMARCARDEKPLCLVIADIDLFRDFNARFGYLAGDAVLRRMAHRLADGLRAWDVPPTVRPSMRSRRLADADRHALAFLAAGADARVERHVVADHGDAHQASGPLPISVAPLTG